MKDWLLIIFPFVLVFIGMGKECKYCGADMDIAGNLHGAGGYHLNDCPIEMWKVDANGPRH